MKIIRKIKTIKESETIKEQVIFGEQIPTLFKQEHNGGGGTGTTDATCPFSNNPTITDGCNICV